MDCACGRLAHNKLDRMSFWNPFQSAFGLEVTNYALRAVELRQTHDLMGKKLMRLASFNEIELPPGIVTGGVIINHEALVKKLKKLIHTAQGTIIKNRYVVSVLPDQKTFVKMITVPRDKTSAQLNIGPVVREEMQKHLPFNMDEMVIDWQVARERPDNFEVLVGACEKTTVDPYLRLLRELGLIPVALEIEALTVARAVVPPHIQDVVLVVDVGKSRSSIVLLDHGMVQFSVTLPIAGTELTQHIMDATGLSHDKAEQLKFTCGVDPKKCRGEVYEALKRDMADLVSHITQTLHYYRDHYEGSRDIAAMVLIGSHAAMPALAELLHRDTMLTAIRGDPFVNVAMRKKQRKLLRIPDARLPAYATVIGLALRGALSEDIFHTRTQSL